ncbi:MAG TPA: hypothetical protein VFV99_01770, partial [Kofleriaceae bacterium]|nr:hypothetical protein [Kofleriaceae bacterium]
MTLHRLTDRRETKPDEHGAAIARRLVRAIVMRLAERSRDRVAECLVDLAHRVEPEVGRTVVKRPARDLGPDDAVVLAGAELGVVRVAGDGDVLGVRIVSDDGSAVADGPRIVVDDLRAAEAARPAAFDLDARRRARGGRLVVSAAAGESETKSQTSEKG